MKNDAKHFVRIKDQNNFDRFSSPLRYFVCLVYVLDILLVNKSISKLNRDTYALLFNKCVNINQCVGKLHKEMNTHVTFSFLFFSLSVFRQICNRINDEPEDESHHLKCWVETFIKKFIFLSFHFYFFKKRFIQQPTKKKIVHITLFGINIVATGKATNE